MFYSFVRCNLLYFLTVRACILLTNKLFTSLQNKAHDYFLNFSSDVLYHILVPTNVALGRKQHRG